MLTSPLNGAISWYVLDHLLHSFYSHDRPQSEEEMARAVRYCAKKIDEKFEGEDIVVVCILKGCVYFFVDLTRAMKIPYSTYFLEASSYHDSQTQAETVELLRYVLKFILKGQGKCH